MLRGEVWLINLDPTIGAEIRKKRFIKQLGKLSDVEMCEITNALATVLSISNAKNGDNYES